MKDSISPFDEATRRALKAHLTFLVQDENGEVDYCQGRSMERPCSEEVTPWSDITADDDKPEGFFFGNLVSLVYSAITGKAGLPKRRLSA